MTTWLLEHPLCVAGIFSGRWTALPPIGQEHLKEGSHCPGQAVPGPVPPELQPCPKVPLSPRLNTVLTSVGTVLG